MKLCTTLFIVFVIQYGQLWSQLPATDLYLAEFNNISSKPHVLSLKYLSGLNPSAYNNQPKFSGYDEIFFTAAIDTQKTTDIYHINLKNNELRQFTKSKQISEFSPSPVPGKNLISCVRIEPDGKDQSLWTYPNDRSSSGTRLFPDLKNVGYHSWINKDSVALFLVGATHSLIIADVRTGKFKIFSENIGRCIKFDGERRLLFVDKTTPEIWLLKSINLADSSISTLCQMPVGRDDFDVMVNGKIIVGDGSFLKTILPGNGQNWTSIADFSPAGIQNISRIAVSRDRVVFVNTKS